MPYDRNLSSSKCSLPTMFSRMHATCSAIITLTVTTHISASGCSALALRSNRQSGGWVPLMRRHYSCSFQQMLATF